MKAAYIYSKLVLCIFLLLFAALTPVYLTPGKYWWTALSLLFIVSESFAFTNRINKWEQSE